MTTPNWPNNIISAYQLAIAEVAGCAPDAVLTQDPERSGFVVCAVDDGCLHFLHVARYLGLPINDVVAAYNLARPGMQLVRERVRTIAEQYAKGARR